MNLENIILKSFVDLNDDEKSMVLIWRNNDDIRRWMYNPKVISTKEHLKFIETLVPDGNNLYFLIQQNSENIGVIYFNEIDCNNCCYFGLYANPFSKVVGVGRVLEEVSIRYVFDILKIDTLKLEVFSANAQVVNLHKKYKFVEFKRKIINKKEVICMELKNENR